MIYHERVGPLMMSGVCVVRELVQQQSLTHGLIASDRLDQCLVYLISIIGTSRYDTVYKPSLVNFKIRLVKAYLPRYNL